MTIQKDELIQRRYRLEEVLGQGGMAAVWRAFDERLERTVAVKLLGPRYAEDAEFLVRFFSEAQAVARISHPNVVSVLDFGQIDGRPFLVMHYVPGGSVSDLSRNGQIMPERALEIAVDAARGAGAAHDIGLIHRDIKSANILLDADGTAKLADFGIAHSASAEPLTATGRTIGSPHYISPEQASGATATPASDVYSLGIVLFELLTGHKPFEDARTATAVAIAHVDKQPERPSKLVPHLSASLDELVLRCLAKDASDRFEDGNDLADALEGELTGRSPVRHVSISWEADEPSSPHWSALLVVVVVLVAAILVGVGVAARLGLL